MLHGELVVLRALVPEDFDALFALESELDTWELRSPAAPTPLDRAAWEEKTRGRLAGADERSSVRFAIEGDDRFAGTCSLMDIDPLARRADVGIALVADARGRGYGTDALRVLARFAFARHNLHRLQLEVLARNAGAIASYRKVGFVEEGRLRENAWVDGGYEDELVMGLLRDELA